LNFLKKFFSKENASVEEIKKESTDCFCPEVDPFSHCIINPYFKSTEDFSKVFSEFETRMGSLQRYFEMNNMNIKFYLGKSKDILKKTKRDGDESEEDLSKYGQCHFADVDYFYEMHYLSILLIIFTMFENLLSNLVKDISYISKIHLNSNSQKELPYINKYILFLKNQCKLDIKLTQKEWHSINTIRKVRNNYLHNLDTDIPEDLQKELLKIISPKNNNKVTVNEEFLDMCFSLFGDIASQLETSYWEYKRYTFKIK